MAASVRTSLVYGIFESIGNPESDAGGLAKLHCALSIPMQERQSGGGAGQDELKYIAGCLYAIIGPSYKDCGQEQERGQEGGRVSAGAFLCLAHTDLSGCRLSARGWQR